MSAYALCFGESMKVLRLLLSDAGVMIPEQSLSPVPRNTGNVISPREDASSITKRMQDRWAHITYFAFSSPALLGLQMRCSLR